MKKLLLAFILVFFTACFDEGEKVYKVGISPDYPPFDTLVDGKVSGFDAELLDNLAKIAGIKYEFKTMSFDGLIAGLKAGKIDMIISAMSSSEQRKKACDFSDVYYKAKTIFIKNKADNYKNKDDLANKLIGVQLGTVQEANLKKDGLKAHANENPTVLIMSLLDNKINAIAFDALVAREYLAKYPELDEFLSEDDGSDGFSIAFSKGKNTDLQEKLNKALAEFKTTSEYQELLKKYKIQ